MDYVKSGSLVCNTPTARAIKPGSNSTRKFLVRMSRKSLLYNSSLEQNSTLKMLLRS